MSDLLISARPQVVLLEAAKQGVPGIQGPPGPAGGSAFQRKSPLPLSALKVVWEDANGDIRPLDYRDALHIDLLAGISLTSTSIANEQVNIQRSGPLDATGLGLTPGRVWLGEDGALTQIPPTDGFDVLIGYATADQRIFLDLNDGIELEI